MLHGKETKICGDSGYTAADKREELQHVHAGDWIAEKLSNLRARKNKRDRRCAERGEHCKACPRAKMEHPFRVIKRQFVRSFNKQHGLP